MKTTTSGNTLGVKLFPFFFCGACALLLVVLALNGTVQKSQMFVIAPCVMAAVGLYLWKANRGQLAPTGEAMKRISNPYTFANKLFPFLFCGFCALLFVMLAMNGALQKAPLFLAAPCLMAVAGYFIWKRTVQDLMDQVYDCGNYLLLRKGGEEDTLLLSNITGVNFTTLRRGEQPRIHLTLDSPGKFGSEISFAPPPNVAFPHKNEIAEGLRVRAAQARAAHSVG
ncbi:MAG TPA: hypothetical protein VN862_03785 [Candidatus Acidoferrales bacterium]|nr:hypothetical protein [Candidatus Acidoferrales bacterium]